MKPKVLIITLNPCYPLNHGGALAQYYFIDGLKDKVQFVLCTVVNTARELEDLVLLKNCQPELSMYYLNTIQPVKKRNLKSEISLAIRMIYRVLSGNWRNKANKRIETDDFEDPYFMTLDVRRKAEFIELINEVVTKEAVTHVQFEFYDTMDLCFAVPESVRKIFIHHELRFKRLKLASRRSPLPDSFKEYLISKSERFERLCSSQMDTVVVFNDDDACLLEKDCRNIVVSPFGIPDELIFNREVSQEFNRFLIVGGEDHTPNKLGLLWFLDTIYIPLQNEIIWPVVILGDWSAEIKAKYKTHTRIIFAGRVDSIGPWFENSVFVNPILTGAGLRTKVLHALCNKVPVFTTKFGAEGILDERNAHLKLFDSVKDFLGLYKVYCLNQVKTAELAQRGFEFFNQEFDKEKLITRRLSIYK